MGSPPKDGKQRLIAWGGALRGLWLLSPMVTWAVDFSRNRHNNYKIFKYVFWHVLERRNLYLSYPEKYGDSNHYGPLFAVVIAPFALLPDALGGLLWNGFMAGLLYLAIDRMGLAMERKLLVMLVCSVDLVNANWSNQFNPAIAAVLLLTFASVEEGRSFLAPLWILVGAFVKLYSGVGLLLLLFARNRKAFLVGCVTWSAVLFLLPMALSSPEYVVQTYREWFDSLVEKNGLNVALHSAQDVSIMGAARRLTGLPLPSVWFHAVGIPLVLAPFLRVGQYRHREFRILALASLLMFIVLFSSASENATYVILGVGAGLWLAHQEEPFSPRNAFLLFCLLLSGLAPTDLLSRPVRLFVNQHALRAIPAAVVWFLLCRDLLMRDFGLAAAGAFPLAAGPRPAERDMIRAPGGAPREEPRP